MGPDAIVQCLDFREELNMVEYVKRLENRLGAEVTKKQIMKL